MPNACTDNTAQVSRDALDAHLGASGARLDVVETPLPGKSRAWNLMVHELAEPDTEFLVFVDADIVFAYDDAISDMIAVLERNAGALVCAGWPQKDIANKPRKSLIDRFSLAVSRHGTYEHAICGQLYVARASALRDIWLPVPTPGEDGFLNAMVQTNGFSEAAVPMRVRRGPRVTHFFEAISLGGYFKHERRMLVGTAVNTWLFEHFMAQHSCEPVGPQVRARNTEAADWVQQVVSGHTTGKFWVLPTRLLTWRFDNIREAAWPVFLRRAPFSFAASLLNLVPAINANRALKRTGSSSIW